MSQSAPEPRIGDAERESAVQALGEHYAAGRLTKEEYDERSTQAFAARTASQLWPLFADLPRPQAPPAPGPRQAQPIRQPVSGPARPGWGGAGLLPVFLVLLVLAILGPMPWFVVFVVGGVMWFKMSRHWGHRSGSCGSMRR